MKIVKPNCSLSGEGDCPDLRTKWMQSTIHSCLSACGEGIGMVRDFIVEMMSEYRLDVSDMEDMDVGKETYAL